MQTTRAKPRRGARPACADVLLHLGSSDRQENGRIRTVCANYFYHATLMVFRRRSLPLENTTELVHHLESAALASRTGPI